MKHYHEEVDGLCCKLTHNVMAIESAATSAAAADPAAAKLKSPGVSPGVTPSTSISNLSAAASRPPPLASGQPPSAPKPAVRGLQEMEIPLAQLMLGDVLGSGEFGEVVAGVWNKPGARPIPCAIKVLKASESSSESTAFLQEATTWVNLVHKNVVCLLGVSMVAPMKLVSEVTYIVFCREKEENRKHLL